MVKTSRRRRSKRRPCKTAKKRKRKTKYSYKKKNHVGGGKFDKLWQRIKEHFKSFENPPTLEDFKRLIKLLKSGEVDKLADEIIKLIPKPLSKEQVVVKIEYVKRLSKPELLKQLKKYFPGLLEHFKQRRRRSLSKNSSGDLVKSIRSKSNLSTKKRGGGDEGMSALYSLCIVLLIFALCWGMVYVCSHCLDHRGDAAIERYRVQQNAQDTEIRRRRREMERRLGIAIADQDTSHLPGEVQGMGNSLEQAEQLAAAARPEETYFYKINDPLITEDSEIDKYIEVIDVEQGEVQAEGEVCGICSVEYAEGGDEVVKLNLCGDTFHKGCITRWLKSASKCPLCNRSLRIDSEPPPAQAESSP